MSEQSARRRNRILLLAILLISAAVKLYASQLLAWEADYVPLIARGQAWLDGGAFPAVGALSSVAAYNMPFLVWMQIPALLFTRDAQVVLVGTQLAFNLLGTWLLFRLGRRIFSPGAGLIAAALFAFSETGISSAYTAWAQMQLPVFYVAFAYCLYLWKSEGRNWQVALSWIIATAAFMTHFSAVLLYAALPLMWLLLRMPAPRRGLAVGLLVSAAMLAPYMTIQARSDFVDLRAFFSQRSRISPEALAEFAHLKPEARAAAEQAPSDSQAQTPTPETPQAEPSRFVRGLRWLASIPLQLVESLRLAFQGDLANLRNVQPSLYLLSQALRALLEACFWFGIAHALLRCVRGWRAGFRTGQADEARFHQGWRLAREQVTGSPAGGNLFLLLLTLAIASGLVLVRAGPQQQPSYYTGLIGLKFLMCSYAIACIANQPWLRRALIILVLITLALAPLDRVIRVSGYDRAAHTPLNLGLYSNINAVAAWIAADRGRAGAVSISYDLFPEMAYQWWVVAWHSIDESYRIGMALDHLLASYHDILNDNRNPAGLAEDADYIVTSAPGVERYDPSRFERAQLGAYYVLKPKA